MPGMHQQLMLVLSHTTDPSQSLGNFEPAIARSQTTDAFDTQGALGLGDLEDAYEPEAVDLTQGLKPRAVAAGHYHSLAVSAEGQIWSWGCGFIAPVTCCSFCSPLEGCLLQQARPACAAALPGTQA